jgi:hypothetical protein
MSDQIEFNFHGSYHADDRPAFRAADRARALWVANPGRDIRAEVLLREIADSRRLFHQLRQKGQTRAEAERLRMKLKRLNRKFRASVDQMNVVSLIPLQSVRHRQEADQQKRETRFAAAFKNPLRKDRDGAA